ncbi:MAG: GNAT family N-acetyltransferase [Kofleriaceae bacterium]|nr:GNAT family N-acetyltransferase [Kofleriaceae bacterium]
MEAQRQRQQVVADLLALAVLPVYLRKGIGSRLLEHVIDVAERVARHVALARSELIDDANRGSIGARSPLDRSSIEARSAFDRVSIEPNPL